MGANLCGFLKFSGLWGFHVISCIHLTYVPILENMTLKLYNLFIHGGCSFMDEKYPRIPGNWGTSKSIDFTVI